MLALSPDSLQQLQAMAEDLIRYDIVIQDALRGAVRKILTEVARIGLPGDHHFYIAFDTNAPGVRISPRLHERYPTEMTVVLQHQFWDLNVTDHAFEVGLSFGGIPEKLFVPFSSIKGFFDPSVQFALEFEPGKKAVGLKTVTTNEEFFNGHFPLRPIMPGVLQVEAMAQVGGIVALQEPITDGKGDFFFAGVNNVKWRRPVVPGDTLVMEMTMTAFKKKFGLVKMDGVAYIDGQKVVEGEFQFAMVQ